VCGGLRLGRKKPGALQNYIYAQVTPGQRGRVSVSQHPNTIAIHDHAIAIDVDRSWKTAMRSVVTREVCVGLRVAEVVNGDNLNGVRFTALVMSPQNVPTNAAVAINCNPNRHRHTSIKPS
jgi:hypothetical protein